jgi:hypothetical protein
MCAGVCAQGCGGQRSVSGFFRSSTFVFETGSSLNLAFRDSARLPGHDLQRSTDLHLPSTGLQLCIPGVLCACWGQSPATQAYAESIWFFVLFFPSCKVCLCFVFQDRVSLCSPGCPGTHCVDQAGLDFTEIRLLLPPKWRSYRCALIQFGSRLFYKYMSRSVCAHGQF